MKKVVRFIGFIIILVVSVANFVFSLFLEDCFGGLGWLVSSLLAIYILLDNIKKPKKERDYNLFL